MNNVDTIIELTQKAISESGKPFDKIDKKSLMSFLQERGVSNENVRNSIFEKLREMNTSVAKNIDTKVVGKTTQSIEEKIRTPRKSVFGEIKRIA